MSLIESKSVREAISKTVFYGFGVLLSLLWLVPFVISIFTATKSLNELMADPYMWLPPQVFTWDNFLRVWTEGNMSMYFRNSVIITVPAIVGTLFLSSLSAFALAFYRFRLNTTVLMIFVAGMLIPFQMLLIPVYQFSNTVGIYDTFQGVILFHIAFQLGFCTFFLRNFMKTIPPSLVQSARIDGANDFAIYRKIIMPLTVSSLAALSVLEFTWIWNDYLWGLVLIQSDNLKPVTLGLVMLQGQWVSSYNLIAAGAIIAAAAPIAIFLFFQRYFIQGLTVGAIKG
jgi:multiple sugar transport system permease protein